MENQTLKKINQLFIKMASIVLELRENYNDLEDIDIENIDLD